MTLDAFERAVRNAVFDKLGGAAGSRPGGADELLAQVFSALTGKDAKSALEEVRQRLAEPASAEHATGEGDVIDLGAVRDARHKASLESAQKIGGALKDSFLQFLGNLAQRPGISGEITLDAAFFRQHGSSLLGNLFQGLAAALIQQAQPAPGASDEAPAGTTPTQAPPARSVSVKLDLGSILAGLFRRRDTPPDDDPPSHA